MLRAPFKEGRIKRGRIKARTFSTTKSNSYLHFLSFNYTSRPPISQAKIGKVSSKSQNWALKNPLNNISTRPRSSLADKSSKNGLKLWINSFFNDYAEQNEPNFNSIDIIGLPKHLKKVFNIGSSSEIMSSFISLVSYNQPQLVSPRIVWAFYEYNFKDTVLPQEINEEFIRFLLEHSLVDLAVSVAIKQCLLASNKSPLWSPNPELELDILNRLIQKVIKDHNGLVTTIFIVTLFANISSCDYRLIRLISSKHSTENINKPAAIRQLMGSTMLSLKQYPKKMKVFQACFARPIDVDSSDGFKSSVFYVATVFEAYTEILQCYETGSLDEYEILINNLDTQSPLLQFLIISLYAKYDRWQMAFSMIRSLLKAFNDKEMSLQRALNISPKQYYQSYNSGSAPLAFEGGYLQFLFTGDLENLTRVIRLIRSSRKKIRLLKRNNVMVPNFLSLVETIGISQKDITKIIQQMPPTESGFLQTVKFLNQNDYICFNSCSNLSLLGYHFLFRLASRMKYSSLSNELLTKFNLILKCFENQYQDLINATLNHKGYDAKDDIHITRLCCFEISLFVRKNLNFRALQSLSSLKSPENTISPFGIKIFEGVLGQVQKKYEDVIINNHRSTADIFYFERKMTPSILQVFKTLYFAGPKYDIVLFQLLKTSSNHLTNLSKKISFHDVGENSVKGKLSLNSTDNFERNYQIKKLIRLISIEPSLSLRTKLESINFLGSIIQFLSRWCNFDSIDINYQADLMLQYLDFITKEQNAYAKSVMTKQFLQIVQLNKPGLSTFVQRLKTQPYSGFSESIIAQLEIILVSDTASFTNKEFYGYLNTLGEPASVAGDSEIKNVVDTINFTRLDAARKYIEEATSKPSNRVSYVCRLINHVLKPSNITVFCYKNYQDQHLLSDSQKKDLFRFIKSKLRQSMLIGMVREPSRITSQKFAISKAVLMTLIKDRVHYKSEWIDKNSSDNISFSEAEANSLSCVEKFNNFSTTTTCCYELESRTFQVFLMSYIKYNILHNFRSLVFFKIMIKHYDYSCHSERLVYITLHKNGVVSKVSNMSGYRNAHKKREKFFRKLIPLLSKAKLVSRQVTIGHNTLLSSRLKQKRQFLIEKTRRRFLQ